MKANNGSDFGVYLDEAAIQSLKNRVHLEIRQMSSNLDKINSFLESICTTSSPDLVLDDLHSTKQKTNKLAASIKENIQKLCSCELDDQFKNRQLQSDIKQYSGDFSNILRRFQLLQHKIEERETQMLKAARSAAQTSNSYDGFDYNNDSETSLLLNSAYEHEEISSLEVHQREQAILQTEREIRDINEIFRDFHGMVLQQGEQIESIEDSVMLTTANVNSGMEHLRQAQVNQTSSRKSRFIFLAILVVFVVIMILIVVFSNRSSNPTTSPTK